MCHQSGKATLVRNCAPSLCPAQAPSTAVPPRKESFRQSRKRPAPPGNPADTITVRGAAAPPTPPGFCNKQQLDGRCGTAGDHRSPLQFARISGRAHGAVFHFIQPCLGSPSGGAVAFRRLRGLRSNKKPAMQLCRAALSVSASADSATIRHCRSASISCLNSVPHWNFRLLHPPLAAQPYVPPGGRAKIFSSRRGATVLAP